ncbi:Phosphoglycolate phosphatase [Burkholderiales bacterium 8X]|nr:Phosphoglycolate phosphatase [Burkholderiales bacterium 8X]
MNLQDFDAAIIDLDGTLIDTIGDFVVALNRMLDDLGLPPIDRDTIARMIGKGSEHLIASVLRHVRSGEEADADLFARAFARYQHHYLSINGQHAPVFPGVVEGLEALSAAGLRLACLTNKPTAFVGPLLAAKALDRFFPVVFGGDAFERKKPDPLPLLKTCEALGTRLERTLMVGDSSNDARAARAAGCPVVLVSYGYNHGEPIGKVDADGVIDSIAQLARRSASTRP